MNFKQWLLQENTVAQELKKIPPESKNLLANQAHSLFNQMFNFNVDPSKSNEIINWITLNLHKDPNFNQNVLNHVDFLISKYNKLNFKDPNYNLFKLSQDDSHFQNQTKSTNLGAKGSFGHTIIQFPDGWKWIDLQKSHCDLEAKAMGHCGNTKGITDPNQNILSLRNPNNVPYLTFIDLGNGNLGEMKGRFDNKPEKKFHPYIIELLKHPTIKKISGGGFAPDKNFSLSDLPPNQKQELLDSKPDLLPSPSNTISSLSAQDDDIIRNLIDHNILLPNGTLNTNTLNKVEKDNPIKINSVKKEFQNLSNNPLLIGNTFSKLGIQIEPPLTNHVIQNAIPYIQHAFSKEPFNVDALNKILPYQSSQPELFNSIYEQLNPNAQKSIQDTNPK